MTDAAIGKYLNDGDCLTWPEGAATSTALIADTVAATAAFSDLRIWFGMLTGAQRFEQRAGQQVGTYAGFFAARDLLRRSDAELYPVPYSLLSRFLSAPPWKVSIVIANGRREGNGVRIGPHIGYAGSCIEAARLVILQPVADMPVVAGAVIDHVRSVVELPARASELPAIERTVPDDIEREIAAHVASLVPDGATIQLGMGRTVDAVGLGLAQKRNLGIHSGLITDAAWQLMECGAVTNARKAFEPGRTVATGLIGTREFYSHADGNEAIRLHRPEVTHARPVLHGEACFVAINSALEVDLAGQANSESIGGVYIGAVGGLPDFHGAAFSHRNGRAIIALPSQMKGGKSRIVAQLNGPATLPASEADFVVTEYGVAELRGRSLASRREALIAIAHPAQREQLRDGPQARRRGGGGSGQ